MTSVADRMKSKRRSSFGIPIPVVLMMVVIVAVLNFGFGWYSGTKSAESRMEKIASESILEGIEAGMGMTDEIFDAQDLE